MASRAGRSRMNGAACTRTRSIPPTPDGYDACVRPPPKEASVETDRDAAGPPTRDICDRLPKVELHCHVEGTVRPTTVVELARKAGRPLPVDDPTELYRYDSLDSFLAIFWLVQETLADREDWARVADESLRDGAAHGLRYREMFFTPARHIAAGQDLGEIVAGLSEGIERAEAATGVRCSLIGDMDRAYGPEAALEFVEALGELRRTGRADRVIGIGADSTELGIDLRRFEPAFAAARRHGFRTTCHAGEAVGCGPDNIRVALDVLGVERIDHGVAVVEDPDLVRRLADERIPLTVCPMSNVVIANRYRSLEGHPFRSMHDAGLLLTVVSAAAMARPLVPPVTDLDSRSRRTRFNSACRSAAC